MRGGALILAAGFSRRFGSDKRRHVMSNGTSLLVATIRLYLSVYNETAVILRRQDDEISRYIKQVLPESDRLRILHSEHSESGMGHTISDGIKQLTHWKYVILALGDMPRSQPSTLATIKKHLVTCTDYSANADPKIVQPYFNQIPGHPVGFTQNLFDELQTLTGDQGAKSVLKRHSEHLIRLEVNDPGVLWDLDVAP